MLQFGSRTSASNVSKALDIYYTMPQKIQATESTTVKLNIPCSVPLAHCTLSQCRK